MCVRRTMMNFLAPLVSTKYTFTNDVTSTRGGSTKSALQTRRERECERKRDADSGLAGALTCGQEKGGTVKHHITYSRSSVSKTMPIVSEGGSPAWCIGVSEDESPNGPEDTRRGRGGQDRGEEPTRHITEREMSGWIDGWRRRKNKWLHRPRARELEQN